MKRRDGDAAAVSLTAGWFRRVATALQTGNHRLPMLIRDHLVCRFARAYRARAKAPGRLRLNRAWPDSGNSGRCRRVATSPCGGWRSARTGILAVTMALDAGCLLVRSLLPNRGAKGLYGTVRPLIACNRYIAFHLRGNEGCQIPANCCKASRLIDPDDEAPGMNEIAYPVSPSRPVSRSKVRPVSACTASFRAKACQRRLRSRPRDPPELRSRCA